MSVEDLEMRCPRLGGPVNFHYCQSTASASGPCGKILDCWWQRFDVAGYLKPRLTEREFKALGRQPASKVTNLIELIEEAKKNTGRG